MQTDRGNFSYCQKCNQWHFDNESCGLEFEVEYNKEQYTQFASDPQQAAEKWMHDFNIRHEGALKNETVQVSVKLPNDHKNPSWIFSVSAEHIIRYSAMLQKML